VPLRGSFRLRLLDVNPLFERFALDGIAFTAGAAPGRQYKVTGGGTYQQGGEVALFQQMFLQVNIDDGVSNRLAYLTNGATTVPRSWPMIQIAVDQTNGTLAQTYSLQIAAAPVQEIWFSTARGFTAGAWAAPTNKVSAGDLISAGGRVVKANADLMQRLGIMPPTPDLGLNAVDILPGGEVVFSLNQDVFSETLGALQNGDLVSANGRIVMRNQDFTRAFGLPAPVPDAGLDGAQLQDDGEVYFSTRSNLMSAAGVTLHHGDLLSDRGVIVKSNQQLLANLHPVDPSPDYGLRAFYVWPSGEIWFSVAQGFQAQSAGQIQPGDLLSDQGYIVFRNAELVSLFAPVEGLADYGLDALYIVTDAIPPALAPLLVPPQTLASPAGIRLGWDGKGRVFQVEASPLVTGPFLPASPIQPDSSFDDVSLPAGDARRFYRVRQW